MVRFTYQTATTDVNLDTSAPDLSEAILYQSCVIAGWSVGDQVLGGQRDDGVYYAESNGETVTAEVIGS